MLRVALKIISFHKILVLFLSQFLKLLLRVHVSKIHRDLHDHYYYDTADAIAASQRAPTLRDGTSMISFNSFYMRTLAYRILPQPGQ